MNTRLLFAAIVSASALTASAQQTTLFQDNFNAGLAPDWTPLAGVQWTSGGWLHNQCFVGSSAGGLAAIGVHDSDPAWDDYCVTVLVDPIPTQSPVGPRFSRASLLFRTNNLAPTGDSLGPHASYFRVTISTPGDSDWVFVGMDRWVDGRLVWGGGRAWSPEPGPVELVVAGLGNRVTVIANGQTFYDVADSTFTSGGVAILNDSFTHARYDEFRVFTPSPGAVVLLGAGLFLGALRGRRAAPLASSPGHSSTSEAQP